MSPAIDKLLSGSANNDGVIKAAYDRDMAMAFTGVRHLRH